MIYLDHNATTPVLPEVFEAMRLISARSGAIRPAPSVFGAKLRGVIETARAQDASSRCITDSGKGGAWRLHGFRRSRVAGPARFWDFPLPNG